ncbi:hypothetical protein [Endozoicomonas sp. SCSIO W0465]|nr:hypothetical protein [Endozoicomonas sp. SCSIO W0465]USE36770.1 hypothetical protein MJO57_00550 [Endozoicomonas sp. SCSIO W0465]
MKNPILESLRQSSGNKAGGKKGHQGTCLKQVDIPDYIDRTYALTTGSKI